jgi:hypothetical protein
MLGARIACWMGRIACEEGEPSLAALASRHATTVTVTGPAAKQKQYMLCSNSTTTHNCTNWINTACRQWPGGRLLLLLCNGCALFYTHIPVNTTLS